MNENKQIERAAMLADTSPAEKIDTERARAFVTKTIGAANTHSVWNRPLVWGVSSLAFAAACALAAVLVINPGRNSSLELMRQDQVHAAADSLDNEADSLNVETEQEFELASIYE